MANKKRITQIRKDWATAHKVKNVFEGEKQYEGFSDDYVYGLERAVLRWYDCFEETLIKLERVGKKLHEIETEKEEQLKKIEHSKSVLTVLEVIGVFIFIIYVIVWLVTRNNF